MATVTTRLRELLTAAVADACLNANTGALLSGGIDSSTVVVLARQLGIDLPTFTGYYATSGYDEREYARLVAGESHHEILITPDDFVSHFEAMMRALEPPFQGPGTFGQYMVAKYAAEHADVVLSGEGGDELFGGYARLMIVAGAGRPDGYDDYELPDDYPRDLEAALAYDLERLPALLAVDEQVNAAHGLVAVAPMTAPQVVAFVLAQPARDRVDKVILRAAMVGYVPDTILGRTDKRGFPIPLNTWAVSHAGVRDLVGGYTSPESDGPYDRGLWLRLTQAWRDRNRVAA